MFNCDAIKSLHEETGDLSINPQILTLDNNDKVCFGFMMDSPYHRQCRNCKDFLINNEYFRKTNSKYIENYDKNYEAYKMFEKYFNMGGLINESIL